MAMTRAPAWGQLEWLRVLEIASASLDSLAVSGAVAACPNLTYLPLLKCLIWLRVLRGPLLQRCRLDFVGSSTRALALATPHVDSLKLQGFKWISLEHEDGKEGATATSGKGRGAERQGVGLVEGTWTRSAAGPQREQCRIWGIGVLLEGTVAGSLVRGRRL